MEIKTNDFTKRIYFYEAISIFVYVTRFNKKRVKIRNQKHFFTTSSNINQFYILPTKISQYLKNNKSK